MGSHEEVMDLAIRLAGTQFALTAFHGAGQPDHRRVYEFRHTTVVGAENALQVVAGAVRHLGKPIGGRHLAPAPTASSTTVRPPPRLPRF